MTTCPICSTNISNSCNYILCKCCNCWIHQHKCSGLDSLSFDILSRSTNSQFCPKCINSSLPFADISIESEEQGVASSPNLGEDLKSFLSDLNKVSSNADSCDFNFTTCKFYECQDFNSAVHNYSKNLSAFHLKISSQSKHFDELNTLLSLVNHKFKFIGISETRILKNREPALDFSIPGYSNVSTPTESSAGGVMLYISNSFAFKPRPDLDSCLYLSKLLESVFVEIDIPNKPNIIAGVIYRHPSMSVKHFNSEFLDPFLHKVGTENRQIILLGDFNVNLLDYEGDTDASSFLDSLSSNLILPQILLPTRIAGTLKLLQITSSPMLLRIPTLLAIYAT